ncbi:DUF6882 domain-containing protein [Corynebacterium comes]|uniref:Uncharacterized protein n=1 Tax=Corynebacterium comes TaxID=2675218 RepID=A0A6B8VFM7_9CORY|nr:DUF6882 domain-containing protein [Corynebacterium comes]QGU04072.1 hypothetical protein CETAM_03995 [Corynebacterium comes]
MDLPSPTSLDDLRADGALIQADIDATWASAMGVVTGVEFTGDTARVHRRVGTRDLPATEVARIVDGRWEWIQQYELDIPELHAPQVASDGLISAARTLNGNVPVLLAPFADGTRVLAVGFRPEPGPIRSTLTLGLGGLDPRLDARRALLSFAAARGLGVRSDERGFGFSDGTTVTFDGDLPVDVSGGMSLNDVRADAHFFAAEHQLLLAGAFPDLSIRLDIGRSRALLGDRVEVTGLVIATVTGDTWTWAWADPNLPPTPAANLRRFGVDNGIIDLVRPRLALDRARRLGLVDAAKPVLGMWTHAFAPLNAETTGVVLLDAPVLHLPGPDAPTTRAAVEATLQAPLDPALDPDRARASYAQRRGVTVERPDTQPDHGPE